MPELPPPAPQSPQAPPDDPITSQSFSFYILLTAFLLMITVSWSLYDEVYGLRPWRVYQTRFAESYAKYLTKRVADQKKAEAALYTSPDYKKLAADADALEAAARPEDDELGKQIALLDDQRSAIGDAFKDARGKVGALVYQYEIVPADDKSEKASRLKTVNEARQQTWEVDWPVAPGQVEKNKKMSADQLNDTFTGLISQRAALVAERGDNDKAAKAARAKVNVYLAEHLPGLNSAALEGLQRSARDWDDHLIQVNVNPPGATINNLGGVGLVDRCQSCHVGTDPKLVPVQITLTKADLGMAKSTDAPFTSHPDPDLIKWHPHEKFGCSPCHGGNGRALDSVTKAHGRYEHWLWPLYYPENYNAGCQQCHASDMVTEHAPVLNSGKQLYRAKGCIGCHSFQGFDNQDEKLVSTRQQITQLAAEKAQNELDIPRLKKLGDLASDNATAETYYTRATELTVTVSKMDAQVLVMETRAHNLLQEVKKVGPDLKEVRMKIHKEWIPYWLGNTHEFRPTTKMPQFRLQQDEIQAIAAFIWQSGN